MTICPVSVEGSVALDVNGYHGKQVQPTHILVRFCNHADLSQLCPAQDEKARAERAAARVRDVKAHRNDTSERAGKEKDLRVFRNRGVLRAHERLGRALTKQKDDDRTRRMEALKVTCRTVAAVPGTRARSEGEGAPLTSASAAS